MRLVKSRKMNFEQGTMTYKRIIGCVRITDIEERKIRGKWFYLKKKNILFNNKIKKFLRLIR